MARTKNIVGYAGLAACVVALDQVTKAWAREALAAGPAPFIPGVLDLSLVMNTGAAFSIGSGSTWVFVVLATLICVACTIWVARDEKMGLPLACALGAVAGGGVGNLIDRVAAGQVTDFFATSFIDFPVFNVADIFVTCGVVLVLLLAWREDDARAENVDVYGVGEDDGEGAATAAANASDADECAPSGPATSNAAACGASDCEAPVASTTASPFASHGSAAAKAADSGANPGEGR